MKYACPYGKIMRHSRKIDEILVPYAKIENMMIEFLDEYKPQRVIICIDDAEEFEEKGGFGELEGLKKGRPDLTNYALRLDDCEDESFNKIYHMAVDNEIPVFFANYCATLDMFSGLINNFVISDIYIIEEMGFSLEELSKIAHEHGVKVRVFPNVAQSSWGRTDSLYKFFILPEDIEYYEEYVDVCEIFISSKLYTADPIFESYQNGKWFGPIREIIVDYKGDEDTKHMLPGFGQRRASCEKRCMKGSGCQICSEISKLNDILAERRLYFG